MFKEERNLGIRKGGKGVIMKKEEENSLSIPSNKVSAFERAADMKLSMNIMT